MTLVWRIISTVITSMALQRYLCKCNIKPIYSLASCIANEILRRNSNAGPEDDLIALRHPVLSAGLHHCSGLIDQFIKRQHI